jgi:hypothetical protein
MPLADVIFYFSLSDSVVIALACALCGMLITLLVYWTGKLVKDKGLLLLLDSVVAVAGGFIGLGVIGPTVDIQSHGFVGQLALAVFSAILAVLAVNLLITGFVAAGQKVKSS